MTEYTCGKATDSDVSNVISTWGQSLTSHKLRTLEGELNIANRDLYVVRSQENGYIEAIFDLQNVRNQFSKNLVIFFSPNIATSDDGLTIDEIESAGALLVTIFMELIAISKDQKLEKVKIHSHDRVLLACFSGFATYLESTGGWRAKAYDSWIELEEESAETANA